DVAGAGRCVRAGDRDVGGLIRLDLPDLVEVGGHLRFHRLVLHPLWGVVHDLARLPPAFPGEVLVEQIEPAMALDVGQLELGGEGVAGGTTDGAETDEGDDPGDDDDGAVVVAPTSETTEHEADSWAQGYIE